MGRVEGKVAIVTGGASGIGRATAETLAREGAAVVIADLAVERAEEVVAAIEAAGGRAAAVRTDVSVEADAGRMVEEVLGRYGRLDILVNSAGVEATGRIWETSPETFEHVVRINLLGTFNGLRAFVPRLIEQGSEASVVNLSSLFGLVSMPGQSMYNATKYAVRGMTEALREEMLIAGHPVGVTAVHPGGIKTAIARNARVSAK